MKKSILVLFGLLLTSYVYAAPPVTLVGGDGSPIGSPSNPVSVEFSGDVNMTSNITTTGTVTANSFVSNGTGASSINQGLTVYGQDNATLPAFRVLSNTSVDRVWINGAGNVGIGTTAPSALLHVGSVQVATSSITITGSGGGLTVTSGDIKNLNGNDFYQYNTASQDAANRTIAIRGGSTDISFFNGGPVGIGTTAPSGKLEVVGANDSTIQILSFPANQANVTASDTFIDFRSTTGSEASIAGTAVAGVIAYNTFTGSHYTKVIDADRASLIPNILLEAITEKPIFTPIVVEEVSEDKEVKKDVLDAEGKPTGEKETITEKQILVAGSTKSASNKGQLFSSRICKTKGSVSAIGTWGGQDGEGRDMILSIGTGFVIVANKGDDVAIGDLFISSSVAGRVEKQADDVLRANTVAKATEEIVWHGEDEKTISCILLGG